MKYNRIIEIEKAIKKNKSITNEELCKEFSISLPTLRRDLVILEKRGSVEKVYGGVIAKENRLEDTLQDFSRRKDEAAEEKTKIGQRASEYINDGDIIFIDSGSTAYRIIPFLKNKKDITVVSHSLNVAETLSKYPNIKGVILGGLLSTKTNSFEANVDEIPYRFDKAFISTVGVSREGCTNVHIAEARVKQYAIKHSSINFLVCDKSKFGVEAFNRFARIEDFAIIITDGSLPSWLTNVAKKNNIEIVH